MVNSIFRSLLTILISTAFIYILLATYLFFFQSKFVYFSKQDILQTPSSINLDYHEIHYQTSDRIRISAWYIPVKNPKATVLFCHGNAGNISHRLESIKIFQLLQLNTFIFDYRGYGQSEGRTTENGTYLDAVGAWNYLVEKQKISNHKIIIFGRSLGGAIAAWLAQKYSPAALIIESSFTSIPDIASKIYPIFPVRMLSRFNYNTKEYLSNIRCPLLVIHSSDDEMIPFSHGSRLFESASQPKEFLQIRGSHNEGFMLSKSQYMAGIKTFLYSCLLNSSDN